MSFPLPLRPRTVFLRDFVTMFTWCLCWVENHQDSPVTPRKELKWQKEHRKLTHLGMFPRVTSVQTLSKHKLQGSLQCRDFHTQKQWEPGGKSSFSRQLHQSAQAGRGAALLSRCCCFKYSESSAGCSLPFTSSPAPTGLTCGGEGTAPAKSITGQTSLLLCILYLRLFLYRFFKPANFSLF